MKFDGTDAVILAGGAAVCWGVSLIYIPAGIIVAGVVLSTYGFVLALAKSKSEPKQE